MNPKAAEAWNFAMTRLESARQYLEQDEDGLAKTEIAKAVYMGAGAIYYLLGQGPQEQAAHRAAQGLISDMADGQACADDAYVVARQILTCIANLSPEEDRLPPP
ncbi:MAG TPA: hypothetical protein PKH24_05200 [Sedimentisphaerales bacterium]|jgi:hypothetical protein|nr:hypothetical protein [Sedimentisphaerales bacterium]HNU31499.1 hypothetical protein [Sedimentisphaerales bacterium]